MSGESPIVLARELVQVIADVRADLESMPFFVRPMVKRGYAKRTGRSLDEWKQDLDVLAARLQGSEDARAAARTVSPTLLADLERLAENFRTAPERAAKMMPASAVAALRERSAAREATTRALIEALR